jgi:hypothetical protein
MRREANSNLSPSVQEAYGWRFVKPPRFVTSSESRGELAIGPIAAATEPGTERGDASNRQVNREDNQTDDQKFHRRPRRGKELDPIEADRLQAK